MTLQEHIRQRFGELFLAHEKESKRVQKSGDEDAIHDLRVASRRILENLRVFQGAMDDGAVRPIRRSLKTWMKASGGVRDLDIAIALAAECPAEAGASWAREWQRKRNRRWSRISAEVTGGALPKSLGNPDRLTPDSASPPQSLIWDYTLSAAQNASLALPLLMDRYVLHGNAIRPPETQAEADDAAYHSFRLRTKRLRYTMESFEAFYPADAYREILARLKSFQQTLGWLHDGEVVAEMLRRSSPPRSLVQEGDAFAAFLELRAATLRQDFHQTWTGFVHPEYQRDLHVFLREAAAEPLPQLARRKAKRESCAPLSPKEQKAS